MEIMANNRDFRKQLSTCIQETFSLQLLFKKKELILEKNQGISTGKCSSR